ncbi:hypothetical protein BG006_008275 [Podila minutissima]|uniref:Uncharacterized protein n=1 Tax=Podila minutissima TaxID=64525 RepID=A0A9P5SGD1_9FUNG|nr:hypothetical protein BG006_008275 [Podila minutissima]
MISRLAGDSIWSRYSLAWSAIQAVTVVALETIIFHLHATEVDNIKRAIDPAAAYLGGKKSTYVPDNSDSLRVIQSARVLSVYHILFIVAQLFQLILLCDAMYNKNTIQIIAIVVFNCAMVAYAGLQMKQADEILVRTPNDSLPNAILDIFEGNKNNPTPYHASLNYEIAVLVLMAIFAAVFAFIAYKLYKEFGWSIYKKIGADLAMRDMYKVYQIFIMIVKFDIFFQLGFSAQFLSLIVMRYEDSKLFPNNLVLSQQEMTSLIVVHLVLSTGASIVLPLLAWWGLKRESKLSMCCFIAGGFAALVYNIMKLTQVFDQSVRFAGANKFLVFFLIINLVLGMVTIYLAWVCMKNFNNGLSAHIGKVSGTNIYPMESVSGSSNKRWSIE